MKQRRQSASERGFTLAEVLVAMALLMVAVAGVFPMILMTAKGNTFNRNRINAGNDARRKLEALRVLPYDSLGVGTTTTNPKYVGYYESQPIDHPGYTAGEDTYLRSESEISTAVSATRTILIEAVDDPLDGSGAGDLDGVPIDYKRVTAVIEWKEKGQLRSLRETTYMYGESANVPVQGNKKGKGPMGKGAKPTTNVGTPDTE